MNGCQYLIDTHDSIPSWRSTKYMQAFRKRMHVSFSLCQCIIKRKAWYRYPCLDGTITIQHGSIPLGKWCWQCLTRNFITHPERNFSLHNRHCPISSHSQNALVLHNEMVHPRPTISVYVPIYLTSGGDDVDNFVESPTISCRLLCEGHCTFLGTPSEWNTCTLCTWWININGDTLI
jgi:hypothetical protein